MLSSPSLEPQRPQPIPEPIPIYTELRRQILTLMPAEVGITPTRETPRTWGVLMEMGLEQCVVTLVALADGTTSLYFSNGGGMIGCGEHAVIATAAKALVAMSEQYLERMAPTTTFPLPAAGQVRFYALTFCGVFTADAGKRELAEGRHELAALFCGGQGVITQVRLHVQR